MNQRFHDQELLDRLSELPRSSHEFTAFRVTGIATDPLAASINGGRWAPQAQGDVSFPVLYTSLNRDGAIAEIVSFILGLTPIPSHRPLKLSRLAISTTQTVRLSRTELELLGVDFGNYGTRDYRVTQNIGAALAFLGVDSLVSPSARWDCENLTIFAGNHGWDNRLELVESVEFEWRTWAEENRFI
ncbi:RES family NAD+ phosphorylase [Rhodopseudomonas sp. B29]|uniref:RES family NAD+ phosphorylase n=1 Tax=Rhodopseudomonas sp. B29 TaxID=95607 RepID=UPI0009FE29E9